jgi:hypothetical protein
MKLRIASLILACSAALSAQSFPSAIYTPLVAKDNVQTTLSLAMTAGDTTAFVASTTGWLPNMLAYICDTSTSSRCTGTYEVMLVTAVPGSNALTVTRGYGGTSAVAHASGKAILNAPVSYYNTKVNLELLAVQQALGTNLSNISTGPIVSTDTTDFSAQSCDASLVCTAGGSTGGALVIGANSITMTPVPVGVNGTDSRHDLYVSGGTGTAEACLISGGAGTSGQSSGAIIITCANTHSGAFTVKSASAGIRECFIAQTSAGACYTPPGTHSIYATLYNDALTNWWGAGNNSIISQMFTGDGVIVGPPVTAGGFLSMRGLKVAYGVGGFAASGNLITFRNLADGEVSDIESYLGYVGIKFDGSIRVKYNNIFVNAKSIGKYWVASGVNPNAGQLTNSYITVQANGIYALIDATVAGLSISNFLWESGETGTVGLMIRQTGSGPINELQISNGNVDNADVNALQLTYNASTAQNTGSTPMFTNVRFTNKSSSTAAVANINYPLFGLKFVNCTFSNAGTGDAAVLSGARRATFLGNHFDVSDVGGRALVLQAGSGAEVNSDIVFSGNLFGFNGVTPTTAIATDTAAHAGILFSGNKINGPVSWAATGTKNVWDSGPNYIASETGANNAIAGALVGLPLIAGIQVQVQLAHTLQAGANTFALNGTSKNIKSARNVANNIGTAYAATGTITLLYDGTQWVDVSQ